MVIGSRRTRAARLALTLALWCAALVSGGCVWLQNEFFVWDAAPPGPPPTAGSDAPW